MERISDEELDFLIDKGEQVFAAARKSNLIKTSTTCSRALQELKERRVDHKKYEAALLSMSKRVQACNKCIYIENSAQCARKNGYDDSICNRGIADFYKKQAGFEGENP